jgi:hypothetical protein
VIWGGKSAGKAVCAAVSQALSGRQRGRSSRLWQPCRLEGVPQAGLGPAGQARTHAPFSRARPRLMRLRRFRAAVRFFSQALLRAVPR